MKFFQNIFIDCFSRNEIIHSNGFSLAYAVRAVLALHKFSNTPWRIVMDYVRCDLQIQAVRASFSHHKDFVKWFGVEYINDLLALFRRHVSVNQKRTRSIVINFLRHLRKLRKNYYLFLAFHNSFNVFILEDFFKSEISAG